MSDCYAIGVAASPTEFADAARLFRDYASALPIDLGYQDFRSELSGLPVKYAAPGAILIARDERRRAIGCVGIRPLPLAGSCEMKRLYTSPITRGSGLGRLLTEAAISHARGAAYTELRLDTLPTMVAALRLYDRLGFVRIEPYYAPTPDGTIFMALKL